MVKFVPPLSRYKDRWTKKAEINDDYVRLRNKLLEIGGENVVPCHEDNLQELLVDGAIINPAETQLKELRDSQCHYNAALLYRNENSVTKIGTGWALTDDGLWRQHSWAMKDDTLVETTVSRTKYYGILLSGSRAEEFCRLENVF